MNELMLYSDSPLLNENSNTFDNHTLPFHNLSKSFELSQLVYNNQEKEYMLAGWFILIQNHPKLNKKDNHAGQYNNGIKTQYSGTCV